MMANYLGGRYLWSMVSLLAPSKMLLRSVDDGLPIW